MCYFEILKVNGVPENKKLRRKKKKNLKKTKKKFKKLSNKTFCNKKSMKHVREKNKDRKKNVAKLIKIFVNKKKRFHEKILKKT